MVKVITGNPSNYKVGAKHVGPGFSPDCVSFATVTHTAHVRNAVNIVADRRIRADLVYDASNLNTERIRVVWMSPNDWVEGSRYGNVSFEFSWQDLIKDMHYYWVEVAEYKIPACRILITSKQYQN